MQNDKPAALPRCVLSPDNTSGLSRLCYLAADLNISVNYAPGSDVFHLSVAGNTITTNNFQLTEGNVGAVSDLLQFFLDAGFRRTQPGEPVVSSDVSLEKCLADLNQSLKRVEQKLDDSLSQKNS